MKRNQASRDVWRRYHEELASLAHRAIASRSPVVRFVGGHGGRFLAVASPVETDPPKVRVEWLGRAGVRGVIKLNQSAFGRRTLDQKSG